MYLLSWVVFSVMLVVALFHFYWSFGGQYGLRSAGPSLEGGKDFVPSRILIFIVAFLLLGLAVLAVQLANPSTLIAPYIHYVGYLMSFIFVVRAVGDFRYVGFFKKIYNSRFAKLDTGLFSPLILLLGIGYGILAFNV